LGESPTAKYRVRIALLYSVILLGGDLTMAGGELSETNKSLLFRAEVETVFVKVSVTDFLNRAIFGLKREDFKIYEEKVEQTITNFGQQETPVSVGILFDVSASMKANDNIKAAKSAIVHFLEAANPEDEFFLITFNHMPTLAMGFTRETADIQGRVSFKAPGGRTALYDAVYLGLEQMKSAKNEKKALILISDGEDNCSRYSLPELREFARESDVQIYAIGEEGDLGYGSTEIREIVNMTGGRAFFSESLNELDYYIRIIHSELRSQYVLGYVPSNKSHNGKWRRIRIKLEVPRGLPKLVISAREGYYAPLK
jgi:Ca-activated chloride channel homolog